MNRLRFWVALDVLLFLLFAIALYAFYITTSPALPATETAPALAALANPSPVTPTVPSTDTPARASPTPTRANPSPTVTATPTATPTTVYPIRYTVREGDYLSLVAARFGVSYRALLFTNPGINPNVIVAGQVLIIPDPNLAPVTLTRAVLSVTPTVPPAAAKPATPATATPTLVPLALPPPTSTATRRPTVASPTPAPASARRYIQPSAWILGPAQGSGEDDRFISDLIWFIDENRIPITYFHFDSDRWQSCANNGEWKWSDSLLQKMRSHNPPIRALFWILPLITTNCREFGEAASQGFFIRNGDGSPMVTRSWQGTGGWIDFNNPAAVAYWHSLLDRIFSRAQGIIGGFYTDDINADVPGGGSYSNAFVRDLVDYTRSKVPDGDVVMKKFGEGTPDDAFLAHYGHLSYVNDLESNFAGMREGIRRVFTASSILPAPFSEFTGYAMRVPDTETYVRRLHWGALQPVMENDSLPKNGVPWDPQYPPIVMQSYRYYATLHWELVPFFHTYDELAYRNSWPIFQQPNASNYSTLLGKEFFVQYVTDYMQSIQVTLPAGQWINYWNEQEVFTGPTTISYPVPLGREPIFVANGAVIPMQVRDDTTGHGTSASAGALTVNVFPNGRSSFSYYDKSSRFVVFNVDQTGNALTLCTSAAPSQPLIYRVARWPGAPARVTTQGGAVGVNENWGRSLPALGSEAAVDASAEGWFYDAARQHLIVKLTQVGSSCP